MNLQKTRTILLAFLSLASFAALADQGPYRGVASYTGAILGAGMLTISGPAAEALYHEMNQVKAELVDLGGGNLLYVRYGKARGFGCIYTNYVGKKPKYGCIVSFEDVSTGEPVNTVKSLLSFGRR